MRGFFCEGIMVSSELGIVSGEKKAKGLITCKLYSPAPTHH